MNIDVDEMLNLAYKNLNSAKDGYEAGMLAAAIAIAESVRAKHQPSVSRADIENKPEMKSEAPAKEKPAAEAPKEAQELQNMTPQNDKSQKVAAIMTEAAKKVSERIQEEHKAKPAEKAAEAPKQEAAPALAAPAKADEKDDAYYDSDEWKNKNLTSDELDATWTPRMQKNLRIVNAAKKLQQFVGWCKAGNMPQGWIESAISHVSDKRYTTADDKRIYSPKMVQFMLAGLQGEYVKASQNQAA